MTLHKLGDAANLLTFRSLITHGNAQHWAAVNEWVYDDGDAQPDVDAAPRPVQDPSTLCAAGVTCVDAPTGAGKTVAMVESIRRLPPHTPVMVVVYRRSLAAQMFGMLAGMGFVSYTQRRLRLSNITPVTTPRIVICAPSLRRVQALRDYMREPVEEGQAPKPQYRLIQDEYGQLRAMLSSTRLLKDYNDMKAHMQRHLRYDDTRMWAGQRLVMWW
ncbi:hypothetical protein V8C86DRAFT_3125901 [Haematococcus lacustris]